MAVREEQVQELCDVIRDCAPSITTVLVSQRALDPLLYNQDQLPILNLIEPDEGWDYEGSHQTRRTLSIEAELYMVIWDADERSGQDYSAGILNELRVAIHRDITLGKRTISLSFVNATMRKDDNYPRFIWDLTINLLNVEDARLP